MGTGPSSWQATWSTTRWGSMPAGSAARQRRIHALLPSRSSGKGAGFTQDAMAPIELLYFLRHVLAARPSHEAGHCAEIAHRRAHDVRHDPLEPRFLGRTERQPPVGAGDLDFHAATDPTSQGQPHAGGQLNQQAFVGVHGHAQGPDLSC